MSDPGSGATSPSRDAGSASSPACRSPCSAGWARRRAGTWPSSGSPPSSTWSPTTRAATSTAPGWSPSTGWRRGSGRRSWPRSSGSAAPRPARQGRGRSPARVELEVADAGGRLPVIFFNQSWRASQLPVGTLALFFGPVTTTGATLQMVEPTVEVLRAAGEERGPGRGPTSRPAGSYPGLPPDGEGRTDLGPHRPAGARGPRPGRAVRRPAAARRPRRGSG